MVTINYNQFYNKFTINFIINISLFDNLMKTNEQVLNINAKVSGGPVVQSSIRTTQ